MTDETDPTSDNSDDGHPFEDDLGDEVNLNRLPDAILDLSDENGTLYRFVVDNSPGAVYATLNEEGPVTVDVSPSLIGTNVESDNLEEIQGAYRILRRAEHSIL